MIPLSKEKRDLIEKIGIYHEKIGQQPVVGRILGLFFVSDQTQLTFDEIREALNISKSAASNAINLLLQTDNLTYTTRPGDRKRYFEQDLEKWREKLTNKMDEMLNFSLLLRDALKLRSKENKDYNEHLRQLISAIEYLGKEIPKLLKEWEKRNQ